MSGIKRVLITGANVGLGKDCARQVALLPDTERVYLGCRNRERAEDAKRSVEASTAKSVFEIVILDVADLDSVRAAAQQVPAIDALVLNAGGPGGSDGGTRTTDGVTKQFAVNVLGHALLAEELLRADKISKVVVYAGSEAARGSLGTERPALPSSSVDDFASICDGSLFGPTFKPMAGYAHTKYVAAMWMGSLARRYPAVRVVTISPGPTPGTNGMRALPPLQRFFFGFIALPMLSIFGYTHGVEQGAKRYVDAMRDEAFASGVFYGSEEGKPLGPLIDQATVFPDLANEAFQDNASAAIHRFLN